MVFYLVDLAQVQQETLVEQSGGGLGDLTPKRRVDGGGNMCVEKQQRQKQQPERERDIYIYSYLHICMS